jgi:hypothetical protein
LLEGPETSTGIFAFLELFFRRQPPSKSNHPTTDPTTESPGRQRVADLHGNDLQPVACPLYPTIHPPTDPPADAGRASDVLLAISFGEAEMDYTDQTCRIGKYTFRIERAQDVPGHDGTPCNRAEAIAGWLLAEWRRRQAAPAVEACHAR